MIGLLLLGLMVAGGFWLFFSIIGLIFKLVFTVIGGALTLAGGLIGGFFVMGMAGILGLALLPVAALLMLPLLLPLLFVGTVVWLLTRGHSRRPVVIVQR